MNHLERAQPAVRLATSFEGERCAVPLRIGHYWIQTLFSAHALVASDISDLGHIHEVSRLTFDEKQKPHWIAADSDGRRIVLNSGEYGDHRLFLINFNPQTGALTLDTRFRDPGSDHAGVSMDAKSWPHGFHGDAYPPRHRLLPPRRHQCRFNGQTLDHPMNDSLRGRLYKESYTGRRNRKPGTCESVCEPSSSKAVERNCEIKLRRGGIRQSLEFGACGKSGPAAQRRNKKARHVSAG